MPKLSHGYRRSEKPHPLYTVWVQMCKRCYDPKNQRFDRYGGRGIAVCEAWKASVSVFCEWGLRSGWQPGLQIDRINNDGNYEPDNCRFVTAKVNSRNRRSNRLLTAFGETKPAAAWAEDPRCPVSFDNIRTRLFHG